jgi:UDP-glucose 4-epimerase
MNKALITGGLGFIGYHLSSRLLAEGYLVHAYDNCLRGNIDADIDELRASDRYGLILGDLMEDGCLAKLDRDYTHIFHLAAIVGVRHVLERPYQVLRDNTLCLLRSLELARSQDNLQRFLFPSTSEVYAGTLQHFGIQIPTPEKTPLTVTDLRQARTSYMLSKIYGEALCQQAGVPFTIIRPHNIYGPRMGMAHVIPELLDRAYRCSAGGRLLVFSANHKRTFCYVDDAVELIVRLANSPEARNETFNIGSTDEETSINTLARLVIDVVGKPLDIEPGAETPGSPERRRPDVSAAISIASYTPGVSLSKGVGRTFEWYRTHVYESRHN